MEQAIGRACRQALKNPDALETNWNRAGKDFSVNARFLFLTAQDFIRHLLKLMCYNKQIRVVACCPVEGASRFKCFNSSADQTVDTCHIEFA